MIRNWAIARISTIPTVFFLVWWFVRSRSQTFTVATLLTLYATTLTGTFLGFCSIHIFVRWSALTTRGARTQALLTLAAIYLLAFALLPTESRMLSPALLAVAAIFGFLSLVPTLRRIDQGV